jgi:hypothetical protein
MVVPMPKSKTNDIRGSHKLSNLVTIEEYAFKMENSRQELDRFGKDGCLKCFAIEK